LRAAPSGWQPAWDAARLAFTGTFRKCLGSAAHEREDRAALKRAGMISERSAR